MTSASILTSKEMPSDEILHQFVVNGDLEAVKKIFKEHQNWKAIDDDGETVLHLAFKCKHNILSRQDSIIQTLGCLLDEGLSINLKNGVGRTVLFLAVENRLRCVIDFLLERGANLNARDLNGNSIIHHLIEDQFKRHYKILQAGFIFNNLIEQNDIDFAKWLLSKGVDIDVLNHEGKSAFNLAIERNMQHVMPTLMNYMNNVNFIDERGHTIIEPFFRTMSNVRKACLPILIYDNSTENIYGTQIFRLLLEKGVSVDHVNNWGNNLFHQFLKSYDSNPEIIRLMLQHYKNVNAQDQNGNTALHLIIRKDMGQHREHTIDVVRTLLSKGANVHLKNNFGETIIRQAIWIKHAEVLKALLDYGADVSPSANPGALFLHDISSVPSIKDEILAPMVDMLVQVGWNVNEVRPGDQFTPLMEACRYSNPAIAQKLIDSGADVNYVEKQNLTRPIHVAVGILANKQANSEALFKILLKAGAKVNVKNRRGETALHLAPFRGYFTMKMLLKFGAHVDERNKGGRLPIHEAVRIRDKGAIKALLQFGAELNDEGILREMKSFQVETAYYLTQQWLKLKAANLPVIGGFENLANKRSLQEFYEECLMEAEILKACHLNPRITVYDLLRMDVRLKYVFIANNERLKELVKSPSIKTSFPKYHILILACYNKAIARYQLIKPAKKAWYYVTGIELPDCVERILTYLENEDLRAMVKLKRKKV